MRKLALLMPHQFTCNRVYVALFGLVFFAQLTGCATKTEDTSKTIVTIPDDQWWQSQGPKSSIAIRNLSAVRTNIGTNTPTRFQIGFSNSNQINAFASEQDGTALIVFHQGFLNEFGTDPDALATTLGHEIGHYQLGHTAPGYGEGRNALINASSQALGMIASYFVPFSGLLVGNGVKAVGLGYSRDGEREADSVGMQIAIKAGYSACGSYRLSKRLEELDQSASIAFLSTHPGNSERMENAQHMSLSQSSENCSATIMTSSKRPQE